MPPQVGLVLQAEVSIIEIDDNNNHQQIEQLDKMSPTADVKAFFMEVPHMPGQNKGRMKCNLCAYIALLSLHHPFLIPFCRQGLGCLVQEKILTAEYMTLCRHPVAMHAVSSFPSLPCVSDTHISVLASLLKMV